MADCIFCKNLPKVIENDLAYVVYDINPISKGHALIITKRHMEQIFEATPEEFLAIQDLLLRMKVIINQEHAPDACNIWVNCGTVAGQVVMHAHVHLIPRYQGKSLHINEHI